MAFVVGCSGIVCVGGRCGLSMSAPSLPVGGFGGCCGVRRIVSEWHQGDGWAFVARGISAGKGLG